MQTLNRDIRIHEHDVLKIPTSGSETLIPKPKTPKPLNGSETTDKKRVRARTLY